MRVKSTIGSRFLISLVIYTIIIIVLWFGYHLMTHQALAGSERENTILAAVNLTQQISAELKHMNTVASVIAGSDFVQDFLSEQDTAAYYEKAITVSEIVRRIAYPISSADSVITINENGRFFRFTGGLSNHAIENLFLEYRNEGAVYTIVESDDLLYFCHIVPVYDYSSGTPVRLGQVAMLAGLDKTRRMLGDGIDSAVIQGGAVILSNNPNLEGMPIADVESLYGVVSIAPIEATALSVAAAIPRDALFPESALFAAATVTALCLLLSMIIVLYRYQSSHFIRPMASIIAGVREIGGGSMTRLPETGFGDFDALVADINKMLDRRAKYNAALTAQRQKLFDAEIARKNMRMSLLAVQMDAHFVVNTLKNLKRLSEKGMSEESARMAEGLAAILQHRYAGDALVNVFDEFQILRQYIDIMNIRFGGRFSILYDVEDSLEACVMPGLILQPIVENALTHGLQSKEHDALLVIKGFIRDNVVIFEVSDNGGGIEPEKLKAVRESLAQTNLSDFPEPGLRGVALVNIQRRIHISCGGDYGITIESTPQKGTKLIVSLPVISE